MPPEPPRPRRPPLPPSLPVFRTWDKLKELFLLGEVSKEDVENVTPVPLYQPKIQKIYSFSHVHGFDTWMADIVFFNGRCLDYRFNQYEQQILRRNRTQHDRNAADRLLRARDLYPVLLFVHCNSRLAEAFFLGNRHHRVADILPCFQTLTRKYGSRFSTLITDAAPEFGAVTRQLGLRHIPLNMSDPENYHTLLAPLDRFVRTLRDMLFNLRRQRKEITLGQDILSKCCQLYNNVSHDTLSKVMGFPVSPLKCFTNRPIETEFVRRVSGRNYNRYISDIPEGRDVYVYQPRVPFVKRRNSVMDDTFRVLGLDKGRYYLENTNNPESRIRHVRSKIVHR